MIKQVVPRTRHPCDPACGQLGDVLGPVDGRWLGLGRPVNVGDMYMDEPHPHWYDEPEPVVLRRPGFTAASWDDPDHRLSVLVHVDGRLVDAWSVDIRGTPYEHVARRFEGELRPEPPPAPPAPPAPPRWQQRLDELDEVVGGRVALLALTGVEPEDPSPASDFPEPYVAAWDLVGEAVARMDDAEELERVCRVALVTLWREGPPTTGSDGAALAAAIVWVIGRANDFTTDGVRPTQKAIAERLRLLRFPTALVTKVRRVLARDPAFPSRYGLPPDGLGRGDLLVTARRLEVIRKRDRALADKEREAADAIARSA